MRFVLAIISFVVAAVMIGAGIAQRTILLEPDHVALSSSSSTGAAVTVIDGAALNAYDGSQRLSVSGTDDIIAAYGRTSDVLAWIGDAQYTEVGYDSETGELTSKLVPGNEKSVPTIEGSDLWLDEYTSADRLAITVKVPSDVSFIMISDGKKAAPADVELSWPVDNSTPLAGPLIVAGAVVLLLGLAMLLWAINHMRSSRGPRRKPQKMPKVPRKPLVKPRSGGRRTAAGMIAVPITLVGALVLTGCSADFWPGSKPGAAPSRAMWSCTDSARPSTPAPIRSSAPDGVGPALTGSVPAAVSAADWMVISLTASPSCWASFTSESVTSAMSCKKAASDLSSRSGSSTYSLMPLSSS